MKDFTSSYKTYAHEVADSTFVGMKDDINKLMSLVIYKGGCNHPIVSIWGMGGSGKTTIARRIYNDGKIRHYFDAFAWVCISQQCQIRKNLEEILQHIFTDAKSKEEMKSMADGELVEELYKQQKEKKCLVVLDDVWNRIDWDCLKRAFLTMESYSKILLTTRNKKVAEVGTIHKMNYLDEHEAWELLQKRALKFNNENFRG
ncbi:putative disease resistance protein At1g50180 [Coffea arabica]|uniref:Disease resistance protein At1g50180 n=1 Tax=Coffea arabica TaxID=13443 RepID=A0A6P6TVI6_COFAR|nr:putative disease resistance protein At1g50180 [Coffea arabica]XP_027082344.1 putative disease resistance protein At1g50180 [Coffea arabica]